jgi:hypothetical protein
MIAKFLKFVLVVFSLVVLVGCAPQPVVQAPAVAPTTISVPLTEMPTSVPPTDTPIPALPTATFTPEVQASKVEDVAGVWAITLKDIGGPIPANFTLNQDGTFSIITTGPEYGGATVAEGPFWFENDVASFETNACQNAQGEVFHCVFSYQLFVAFQDGKPARLHMVVVDDPGVGKRSLDGKTFSPAEP